MPKHLYETDEKGMITSFFVEGIRVKPNKKLTYEELQMIRAISSAYELAGEKDITYKLAFASFNEYVGERDDEYCLNILEGIQWISVTSQLDARNGKETYEKYIKAFGRRVDYGSPIWSTSVMFSGFGECTDGDGKIQPKESVIFLNSKPEFLKIDHLNLAGTIIEERFKSGEYGKAISKSNIFSIFA